MPAKTPEELGQELIEAARNNELARMDELIAAGADIEAKTQRKETPLHWAAFNGHVEAVDKLIKAGADLDAREDRFPGHVTPLIWAAERNLPEIAKKLLLAGANLHDTMEDGNTARLAAERNNNQPVIDVIDWIEFRRQQEIDDAKAEAERKAEDERQSRLHREAVQALGKPPKFRFRR